MNRRLLGFVIVAMLVTSAVILLPRPVAAQEPTQGPMADQVVFKEIPNADVAVEDLIAGASDIREFSIPGATTRSRVLNTAGLRPVLGSGNFWNLQLNSVPRADGKLNPFQLQPIREAMNWLIDRDFILNEVYFGYGVTHTTLFYSMEPEYARHAAFIAGLEAQYGYNPTKAHDVITTAMQGAGATLVSGKWQVGGQPVTIDFVIRVDDPRRTNWGNYLAGVLENEGFTVTRDYKTSAQASPIVYSGDPTSGAWQAYTEGWGSSGLTLWDSIRGFQMFRWDAYSQIWAYRSVDAVTAKAIDDWYQANYTSEAQRNSQIETAITGTLKDSTRVWVVAEQTFYVERSEITSVYDLAATFDSPWAVRSARRNDAVGGTITVTQPVGWVGGWNPFPSGITWAYDANIRNLWRDWGVYPHPHTGRYVPMRGDFDVFTAPAGSSFNMPDTAVRVNNATAAWETVPASATAKSVVNFTYNFGKWQDGQVMNMTDLLDYVSVIYRLADPAGDAYSPSHEGDYQLFMSTFKGLEVTGPDTVSVYLDYWHVDPAEIAAVADLWTPVPWYVWELTIQAYKNGGIYYKEDDAETFNGEWMNLVFGPSLGMLDTALTDLETANTIPVGMAGMINAADAASHYASLRAWSVNADHPNYLVSNGPFYVSTVDVPTLTTVLKADRVNYPLAPRAWDSMLVPRIPQVSLGPAPTINLDVGAVFSISVSLFGQPYDEASLSYLVLNPAQATLLFQGTPTRIGPGEYEARLTAAQTQTMTPGAYELKVISTSPGSAVPTIVKQSFLAFTVAGVLEDLIKATEQALKDDIGSLRTRVDTIDQSTSALANDVAGVSNLVLIVLVLSIVAIATSVVSMLILLRRMPRPSAPAAEPMKEERPPEEL